MKTMKIILALVLAGLTGSNAMASGNLKVNIASGSKEMAEVEISNVKMSIFEIDVKNENGDVVFYKETKVPSTNYKRSYDFSLLDDGTYYFTVKIDNETTETKFEIDNGQVNVIDERKVVDPVFIVDNKQLKLSYLNFQQDKSRLIVYDRYRNTVYEKDLKPEFVIQHGLDFSKAQRGNYEVVLSSGNEVHSFDFYID